LSVGKQGGRVLEQTQETEEIIGRVAALDIGKAELGRVPSSGVTASSRGSRWPGLGGG
jgi:hypothetical protein